MDLTFFIDQDYNLTLRMLGPQEEEDVEEMKYSEMLFLKSVAETLGFEEASHSIRLYKVIQATLESNPGVPLPGPSLLASTWLSSLPCPCLENSDVPEDLQMEFATYCFEVLRVFPNCGIILSLYEFRTLQGRNPSEGELLEMMVNRYEMERDPEGYWAKTKEQVPTPNLVSLPVVKTVETEACALCQEDIDKGARAFQMPCCNQYYHCEDKSCLGDSTVLKWLSTSRKCPGCGQEVIIPEPATPKRKRGEEEADRKDYSYESSSTSYSYSSGKRRK